MRALVLENKKKLAVKEVESPVTDGKRVIMKVECVGICGSDLHIWEAGERIGIIMGHEFAGTIVDPGDRKDLRVGDRVTCLSTAPCLKCDLCKSGKENLCNANSRAPGILSPKNVGAYAELFSPVQNEYIRKIPDNMSFEEAALNEPALTGMRAAQLGGVKKGDKVLVAGGGIIGAMTIQWAKTMGADYVALTEVNQYRLEKVKSFGYVDEAFDPREPDVSKKMLEKTGAPTVAEGGGFDVFIDCSGNEAAINFGISLLKKAGTVVFVGIPFKPISFNLFSVVMKQIKAYGLLNYSPASFDECLQAIADGRFPVKQYHTASATLDEAQKYFELLENPSNGHFKVILYPNKK